MVGAPGGQRGHFAPTEASVERTLRQLFLERSGRALTADEQEALRRRAHETTPEQLVEVITLPGDALIAWLLGK